MSNLNPHVEIGLCTTEGHKEDYLMEYSVVHHHETEL